MTILRKFSSFKSSDGKKKVNKAGLMIRQKIKGENDCAVSKAIEALQMFKLIFKGKSTFETE